MTVRKE
ncbi:hypothetical protein D043_3444A, partial [Vibrio parahaemolyticus EKP-021]